MMNFLILIVHHEILNPKLITYRLQTAGRKKSMEEEIEVRDLRELNVKNDFLFQQFKINEMMMHTDILCSNGCLLYNPRRTLLQNQRT